MVAFMKDIFKMIKKVEKVKKVISKIYIMLVNFKMIFDMVGED